MKQVSTVSILVLMDTLLQLGKSAKEKSRSSRFNPCFNGYTTSTILNFMKSIYNQRIVSILVLMDTLLQRIFNKILYLSVLQRFFQTLKSHFFA